MSDKNIQVSGQMTDSFGRVHKDLRISVTDRCNLRCTYCMPEEGLEWYPRSEILTFEEIHRIAKIAVRDLGIESIRLTGGEPLMRADLPVLVGYLSELVDDLSMTTNATQMSSSAVKLWNAGLSRINISLDSLDDERFFQITRRNDLHKVLNGIDSALEVGFDPVKVNMVVMRGVNDDEVADFAAFGREKGVVVRFIEFMPLDASQDWRENQVVSLEEILGKVSDVADFEPVSHGNDPASRFKYLDGRGEFGVIASVTRSFCHLCDRVRLTADGQFTNCLFAVSEYDLRGLLRNGGTDQEIANVISGAVKEKWAGHNIGSVEFIRPRRSMSQIGG